MPKSEIVLVLVALAILACAFFGCAHEITLQEYIRQELRKEDGFQRGMRQSFCDDWRNRGTFFASGDEVCI